MISIFLNLLRFELWPNTWSLLENVPCGLEKNVYSDVVVYKVQNMSVRLMWPIVLSKSTVSLLILCLNDLAIVESGVLKSPTVIVLLFFSPFSSVIFFAL